MIIHGLEANLESQTGVVVRYIRLKGVLLLLMMLTHIRIYPPSCIPLAIRSKTIAVATFFNWGSNFAQTFFTPIAFVSIEWKVSHQANRALQLPVI